MEHRLTILEQELKHIRQAHENILPKILEFDKACEINIPKAESAHKAAGELSKAISDIKTTITTIIKDNDRIDKERKERDERDAVFKDGTIDSFNAIRKTVNEILGYIATEDGIKEGKAQNKDIRTLLIGGVITVLIGYQGWLGMATTQHGESLAKYEAVNTKKKDEPKEDEIDKEIN